MIKLPTPETDAVAAYEGNWDTKALRMTVHARKLERELKELRQWKKEMLFVESQWDEQMVGRLLGLQLGDYIKANIEPKLRQLIHERDEAVGKERQSKSLISIYTIGCVCFLIILTAIFMLVFQLAEQRDDLKQKAVERGCAEFVVKSDGSTTWQWKEEKK
jgi:hypothetical protein